METFSVDKATQFVEFVLRNDVQITVNKRQARALFVDSFSGASSSGLFEFPQEKTDKLYTYLQQDYGSERSHGVDTYAFVRIFGDFRRCVRAAASTSRVIVSPAGATATITASTSHTPVLQFSAQSVSEGDDPNASQGAGN